ncbi:MAG: hypothetical protein HRT35_00640 [Algicola sp.]|nr:hypothetical protein [Algicola sp.]
MQKTFIKPTALSLVLLLGSAFTPLSSFADENKPDNTNISNESIDGTAAESIVITCRILKTGENITYCSVEDESCKTHGAYIYFKTSKEQCHLLGGDIVGL